MPEELSIPAQGLFFYLWTFLAAFIVYKFYHWWKSPHTRFPPSLRGIPFLGVLPIKTPRYVTAVQFAKQCGSVVSMKLRGANSVYLCKYEDIHEAFTKNGSVMSDRPKMTIINDVNGGYGLVEKNYNSICKAHRKCGNSIFKGFLCPSLNIESICQVEAKHFIQHLLKNKTDKPFDIRPEFYNITGNVVARISFGERFEYDDPDFQKIIQTSTEPLGSPKQLKLMFVCLVLPFIRFVPPFRTVYGEYVRRNQQILDYIELQIKKHKENIGEQESKDFIDAYLKQQKSCHSDQAILTDSELRGFVKDLFLAGTDTSSNTLAWAFAILLNYPECQKRLHKEIDTILEIETELGLEHRDLLPYCCAFIQEVMRFRTLLPTGVPHQTSQDVNFKQFCIPKKTTLVGNIWAVHNDPEIWTDPHLFKPERHLDDGGHFVFSPRVIPFSIGLRRCIGERIARTEIFIFFVSILRNFEVLPDRTADRLPDIDKANQLITYAPRKYCLMLQKRCVNKGEK